MGHHTHTRHRTSDKHLKIVRYLCHPQHNNSVCQYIIFILPLTVKFLETGNLLTISSPQFCTTNNRKLHLRVYHGCTALTLAERELPNPQVVVVVIYYTTSTTNWKPSKHFICFWSAACWVEGVAAWKLTRTTRGLPKWIADSHIHYTFHSTWD